MAGLHVHGSWGRLECNFFGHQRNAVSSFLRVAVCDGHSNRTVNLPPGGIPAFGRSLYVLASLVGGGLSREQFGKNK